MYPTGNYLHLNGNENVANMLIFADANNARYSLKPQFYFLKTPILYLQSASKHL